MPLILGRFKLNLGVFKLASRGESLVEVGNTGKQEGLIYLGLEKQQLRCVKCFLNIYRDIEMI